MKSRANNASGNSVSKSRAVGLLFIPQPGKEHFGGIARTVVAEFAKYWGLPVEALPSLAELDLRVGELRSARMVRSATVSSLARAMRAIVKH